MSGLQLHSAGLPREPLPTPEKKNTSGFHMLSLGRRLCPDLSAGGAKQMNGKETWGFFFSTRVWVSSLGESFPLSRGAAEWLPQTNSASVPNAEQLPRRPPSSTPLSRSWCIPQSRTGTCHSSVVHRKQFHRDPKCVVSNSPA